MLVILVSLVFAMIIVFHGLFLLDNHYLMLFGWRFQQYSHSIKTFTFLSLTRPQRAMLSWGFLWDWSTMVLTFFWVHKICNRLIHNMVIFGKPHFSPYEEPGSYIWFLIDYNLCPWRYFGWVFNKTDFFQWYHWYIHLKRWISETPIGF